MNSLFIKPVHKTEIKNIIQSLNLLKAVNPNSILTKILKCLRNDISNQFTELFSFYFSRGVFPSILKTRKVTLIFKDECKLNDQVIFLSTIDITLGRIMFNRLYEFLESKFLIYNLQFGIPQKHSTSQVLIHITDKMREQQDKGNFVCRLFADFKSI